ncbi:MAG: SDR family NAD(P)-dependent oxidoreductase [Ruminococcaceae bacterium]|nr:SDR family NAD(P)-dependent oxidoreductase [Oscillospiraceae bacterium]
MKKQLNVLITGAASGIGGSIADRFLSEGHRVFSLDIKGIPKRENLSHRVLDVTDFSAVSAYAEELSAMGVRLDIIISAAGIHAMASLVEDDVEAMKRLINVNLVGSMHIVRAMHRLLSGDGRIIIITSEVAGFDPMPFNGLYTVSKTALESYAQALRQELGLIGQKVITIRPGAVKTPLADGSIKATADLAERTVLYQRGAKRFSSIASKFMGKPIEPWVLSALVYKAATKKHTRLVYKKHQNKGLVLLNLLPLRLQCAIIKLLLNK